MNYPKRTTLTTALWLLALALLVFSDRTSTVNGQAKKSGDVTVTRIITEEKADKGNWLAHGRTFNEQRFSPLKQINERNVAQQ